MASIWDNFTYNLFSGASQPIQRAAGKVLGKVGGAIHQVGTRLGDPIRELDVSEQLQRLGGMLNPPPVYGKENKDGDGDGDEKENKDGGGGGGGDAEQQILALQTGFEQPKEEPQIDQAGFEQPKEEPQIDWDAIYAPALNAYRDLANVIQGGLGPAQERIGAEAEQNISGLETERGLREAQLGQQREQAEREHGQFVSGEERRTESAIAEARRQANELMQGLQARFGTSTGTGQFAGELLGREAMRGIGEYRTGLQETIGKAKVALENTLGQIDQSLNSLREQVSLQISNVRQQANSLKEEARQGVQGRVAEINARIGETETAKAQERTSALQEYQQYVRDVNTRNVEWEQKLYLEAQELQTGLNQLKSRAVEQFAITLPSGQQISPLDFQRLTGGLGEYAPALQQSVLGQLTGTVDEDRLRGTTLPWQTQARELGLLGSTIPSLQTTPSLQTGGSEEDELIARILGQ